MDKDHLPEDVEGLNLD